MHRANAFLPPPLAILFDLDGTLVDSVEDLTSSANYVRGAYGLGPLPVDVVRGYIGDGARKLVERSLGADDARVEEAVQLFRAHYTQHLLDHTTPYPGVRDVLEALSARPGLRLAVVSNKPQPMCDALLKGLDLARHFRAIVGARSGVPVKPAPDLVALTLERLGVAANQAWIVGDSPNDIGAGRAAGCATVALAGGLGPREALVAAQPDWVLERIGGLPELVARADGLRDPRP